MKLIISFSGRRGGNCDQIAEFIASDGDKTVYFRDLDIHPCSGCDYECFSGECKYKADDIYGLYNEMCGYEKVILIVPMYCGNPSSLYFIFNERCQDYFMHNDTYEVIIKQLYSIGVYGSAEETPDFLPRLEKWFNGSGYQNRVLGIERHLHGQKINDNVLDVPQVRAQIKEFLEMEQDYDN